MALFPRTQIEDLSVSRLIIGTNWFLGFSHTSAAQDKLIRDRMTPDAVADILEVYLAAGVDTILGLRQYPVMDQGIKIAEDRTGKKMIVISTPGINVGDNTRWQQLVISPHTHTALLQPLCRLSKYAAHILSILRHGLSDGRAHYSLTVNGRRPAVLGQPVLFHGSDIIPGLSNCPVSAL